MRPVDNHQEAQHGGTGGRQRTKRPSKLPDLGNTLAKMSEAAEVGLADLLYRAASQGDEPEVRDLLRRSSSGVNLCKAGKKINIKRHASLRLFNPRPSVPQTNRRRHCPARRRAQGPPGRGGAAAPVWHECAGQGRGYSFFFSVDHGS